MLDIANPWQPLSAAASLGGHLGVFELADAHGDVLYVGYAGAQSPFGLRSAVQSSREDVPAATQFRTEVNTAYLTRFQELVMLHRARGADPQLPATPMTFGRLKPA